MKTWLLVGCAVALAASPVPAAAQEAEDDWELAQDAALGLTVAMVRYDDGQAIIVQCRQGTLTAVMAGLPSSPEALRLEARRADGRRDRQTWAPAGAAGAYQSRHPARDARFMRGGGAYGVRTMDGSATTFRGGFDLPTQSANLDRVLSDCGWALTDDRDQLPGAEDLVSISDPDARRWEPPRPPRSVSEPRQSLPGPIAPPAPPAAETQVSCIVRDMHLRDCRADHQGSVASREVQEAVRYNEGREVHPLTGADAALSEGRVLRITSSAMLIVVTREPL